MLDRLNVLLKNDQHTRADITMGTETRSDHIPDHLHKIYYLT